MNLWDGWILSPSEHSLYLNLAIIHEKNLDRTDEGRNMPKPERRMTERIETLPSSAFWLSGILQTALNLARERNSPLPGRPITFPSRAITRPRWMTSHGVPRTFNPS